MERIRSNRGTVLNQWRERIDVINVNKFLWLILTVYPIVWIPEKPSEFFNSINFERLWKIIAELFNVGCSVRRYLLNFVKKKF